MWLVWWDPCGALCWIFGQLVVWFVNYVIVSEMFVSFFRWSNWGIANCAVFETLIVLMVVAHVRAMCSDPGSVAQKTVTPEEISVGSTRTDVPKRRYCRRCQCVKPPRAHHCSTCDRCIMKMDHHCPWVNNCVGQNNMKFFLQFLLYVGLGGIHAGGMLVYRLVYCIRNPRMCAAVSTLSLVLCICGGILAILFVCFVIAMYCDQHEGMTTDTTGIEARIGWDEVDRPWYDGMRIACGEGFGLRWFLPVDLPASSKYKYSPTDDPDAFHPRDPLFQRFMEKQARAQALAAQAEQLAAQEAHASPTAGPTGPGASGAPTSDASAPVLRRPKPASGAEGGGGGLTVSPGAPFALEGSVSPGMQDTPVVGCKRPAKAVRAPGSSSAARQVLPDGAPKPTRAAAKGSKPPAKAAATAAASHAKAE